MNTAYTLADCSRDPPTRERPGVKTRRSGLCQCSVLGKIDQGKFCSLQSGVTAGLRVDSAPQSNRGCRPPDPLHQISCSALILIARSWTLRATLLLLSRFSRVRLCATPEMAAHQAPPSLGFSRQIHWSGLPFPSPVHGSEK